ncbi:GNAT family N-acetyltransferase [Leptospira sp. WS58.C1]|uniref:GNAT family N-acetyltransferase n=1 Tax=Leptospira cinconiae TaxID=3235173 RepID=UPI00349EB91C
MNRGVSTVSSYRDRSDLREKYFEFTPQALYGADFRPWFEKGGWSEKYHPNSLIDPEGKILSNVSVMEMDVLLLGDRRSAIQLGAVGTLPDYRKQGLSAKLIRTVLEKYSNSLVFLFANDSVTDFYPKFGFRKVEEIWFRAAYPESILGKGKKKHYRILNPNFAQDVEILKRISSFSLPTTEIFGAMGYGSILLFYFLAGESFQFLYDDSENSILVIGREDKTLWIYDVLCDRRPDLEKLLASLGIPEAAEIRFGFSPEKFDIRCEKFEAPFESPLFVKGEFPVPEKCFKFPILAQT